MNIWWGYTTSESLCSEGTMLPCVLHGICMVFTWPKLRRDLGGTQYKWAWCHNKARRWCTKVCPYLWFDVQPLRSGESLGHWWHIPWDNIHPHGSYLSLLSVPEISPNELVSLAKLCPCKMLDPYPLPLPKFLVSCIRSLTSNTPNIPSTMYEAFSEVQCSQPSKSTWGPCSYERRQFGHRKSHSDNVMWRKTLGYPESQKIGDGKKIMEVKRRGTAYLPVFLAPSTCWADLLRPHYRLPFPKTTRRYDSIVETT